MADPNDDTGEWRVLDGIDLSDGEFPFQTRLNGEDIVVWKIAGGFRGVQALCPHQEVSLMEATLMRDDTMIRCHRHNFIFRLDNGNGVNCRGLTMKVYEIRETNGKLEALVPS